MMDWSDGSAEYNINDDLKMTITYPEVLKALALNKGDVCTAWQAYIRDCFDWFSIALIGSSITSDEA